MKLQINKAYEIVAYATDGDVDNSIDCQSALPDDFEANFKPKFYLLQNGQIIVNPNYEEPAVDIPELSGPSPEMLAINALGIQLAKHLAGGD